MTIPRWVLAEHPRGDRGGLWEDPAEPVTAGRRLRMVTCGDDTGNSKMGWVCAQDSRHAGSACNGLGAGVEDGGEPVGAGVEGTWGWTVSGNE